MIFQIIGERPLNKTGVPNNLKSFIKELDEKESTENINTKKDQNYYFIAELS